MDWIEQMRSAIKYMEDHLTEPFDIGTIAKTACSSEFHFQRLFHMITGVTVAEYVRRRRLTLAAQELFVGNEKIIDIAFKYGYDTPESFSKAFRRTHGFSPSTVRKVGTVLKAYPPITFQISIKGDQNMEYKIEKREAFKLVGKGKRISSVNGENFKLIPEFWDECHQSGFVDQLMKAQGALGTLGVCMDFAQDMSEFTYFIGIEKPEQDLDGVEEVTIQEATWAKFESIGPMPEAIQKVWGRIFSEFFPATNYEHAVGPDLEVYYDGNPNDPNYLSEVWIPVVTK
ncbi:MAG: AraC family transcriptional regulator [Vallitaleaceae bacterium]|nr:AraC family transcriptional regulator [Vallitaleaceae bacterium]